MAKLSIALVSALLEGRYGGPPEVLRLHAQGLRSKSNVQVYGLSDSSGYDSIKNSFGLLKVFQPAFPKRWFFGKGLSRALLQDSERIELFHAHMLWDYPVFAAWQVARSKKKPLIITPHGSLSNAWRYRGIEKLAYKKFILNSMLSETSFIHVLNEKEKIACLEFGVTCPIRVIPNGLPANIFFLSSDTTEAFKKWPLLCGKRVLLYLGRLWQGKGLDILPEAWAKVNLKAKKNNWILVLAGPDYGDYKKQLMKNIDSLGLGDSVFLTGEVYGELKSSLMSAATMYILPSHGEGFSMSLLEAVAAKRPALFTTQCNFSELAIHGGGWEVTDTSEALSEVLNDLLDKDDSYFEQVGLAGWNYAKYNYTLERVTDQLLDMYKSAIKNV
jgi:glycosyltransferase involved in cell wall biosynthesis